MTASTKTVSDLIESIARGLGDLVIKSSVSTMTATTVDSTDFTYPVAGQLEGSRLVFLSGGNAGLERRVGSYSPSDKRVIFDKSLPTYGSTPTIAVFKRLSYEDYKDAVNRASSKVRLLFLKEYVPTLAIIGTQYRYSIPSGLESISKLTLVPSAGSSLRDWDVTRLVFDFLPPTFLLENNQIVFDTRRVNLDSYNGWIVNVVGQTRPQTLNNITDTTEIETEDYIQEWATAHLGARIMTDVPAIKDRVAFAQSQVNRLENYITARWEGLKV